MASTRIAFSLPEQNLSSRFTSVSTVQESSRADWKISAVVAEINKYKEN